MSRGTSIAAAVCCSDLVRPEILNVHDRGRPSTNKGPPFFFRFVTRQPTSDIASAITSGPRSASLASQVAFNVSGEVRAIQIRLEAVLDDTLPLLVRP